MAAINGRPTKYKPEYCIQAEKLCKKGFIDTEIADFFGVAISTLYKWKLEQPQFSDALKVGKRFSDDKVVNALYDRALGYDIKESKIETGPSGTKETITTKRLAPDTTAQIFWLKNRQPHLWRNNPDETGNDTSHEIKISFKDV